MKIDIIKQKTLNILKFILTTFLYTVLIISTFYFAMIQIGYNSDIIHLQKDNKEIVLIGTVHLATSSEYYKKINKLNNEYKEFDYQLYFERVKRNENISEETKKITEKLADNLSFFRLNANLRNQSDYLIYDKEDVNADVDLLTLEKNGGIKELAKFDFIKTKLQEKHLSDLATKKEYSKLNNIIDELSKYYFRAALISGLHFNDLTGFNEGQLDIILNERNKVLLNSIDYNKNAIVNYGNAHLKGIIQGLEQKGYKIVKKEELKAF